jgi:hypothetical protein
MHELIDTYYVHTYDIHMHMHTHTHTTRLTSYLPRCSCTGHTETRTHIYIHTHTLIFAQVLVHWAYEVKDSEDQRNYYLIHMYIHTHTHTFAQVLVHWAYEVKDADDERAQQIRNIIYTQHVWVPCSSQTEVWADAKKVMFIDDRRERACTLGCPGSHCTHVFGEEALLQCARLSYPGVADVPSRGGQGGGHRGRQSGKRNDVDSDCVLIKHLHKCVREFWEKIMMLLPLTECMYMGVEHSDAQELEALCVEAPLVCVALLTLQKISAEGRSSGEHDDLRKNIRDSVQKMRFFSCSSLHVYARAVAVCDDGVEKDIRSEGHARFCVMQVEEIDEDEEREKTLESPLMYVTRDVLEPGLTSVARDIAEVIYVHVACVCIYIYIHVNGYIYIHTYTHI